MYSRINTQAALDTTVITLDEAKVQCRLMSSFTLDDDELTRLVATSLELAQTYTKKLLTVGTVTALVEDGRDEILVPWGNVETMTEVKVDGVVSTNFKFNPISQKLIITVPYTEAEFTYTAGYTTLPTSVKHAVLMMVSTFYNHHDDVVTGLSVAEIPHKSTVLLDRVKNYVS